MSIPRIFVFVIDDMNEAKFARHRLRARQVTQVLGNRHVVVPNRKGRRGLYLVVGRDNGGEFISIPIEPTNDVSVWRPVTAYPSKRHEKSVWQGKGGHK